MVEDDVCELMEKAGDDHHSLFCLLKENKIKIEERHGNDEVIRFFSEIAPYYEDSECTALYDYLMAFKRHRDSSIEKKVGKIKDTLENDGIVVFSEGSIDSSRIKTLGFNQGANHSNEKYQVSEYNGKNQPSGHRLYTSIDTAIKSERLLHWTLLSEKKKTKAGNNLTV